MKILKSMVPNLSACAWLFVVAAFLPTTTAVVGASKTQTRMLQTFPSPMSAHYNLDWLLVAPDCADHLLSVDLECKNGNTKVMSTTNARCTSLTTKDWIRCTALDQNEVASVHVRCTGDDIESLALLAKSVPFKVSCYEIHSPSILMHIHSLCRPAENESDGWNRQNITFNCLNALQREDGVCKASKTIICHVVDPGLGFPTWICDPFNMYAVFAAVYYSSVQTACLYDADQPSPVPTTPLALPVTSASTQQGDLKRATYKIYFDTQTELEGCLFPAPEVLLICGSGERATGQSVRNAVCFPIRILDVVVLRCIAAKNSYTPSVIATCDGRSDAEREIYAYRDAYALTQCVKGNASDVVNHIWMSVLCGGEPVWGEKRKCLQANYSASATSGVDICSSYFENCDATSCAGGEMIVSASADDGMCLEGLVETSLVAMATPVASPAPATSDPLDTLAPYAPMNPTGRNTPIPKVMATNTLPSFAPSTSVIKRTNKEGGSPSLVPSPIPPRNTNEKEPASTASFLFLGQSLLLAWFMMMMCLVALN